MSGSYYKKRKASNSKRKRPAFLGGTIKTDQATQNIDLAMVAQDGFVDRIGPQKGKYVKFNSRKNNNQKPSNIRLSSHLENITEFKKLQLSSALTLDKILAKNQKQKSQSSLTIQDEDKMPTRVNHPLFQFIVTPYSKSSKKSLISSQKNTANLIHDS